MDPKKGQLPKLCSVLALPGQTRAEHMNRQLRTTACKQKVAIEALKGDRTVNEIAQEYGVHPVQDGNGA